MADFEWDIGVAMASFYDADGFLTVQIDAFGEGDSGVSEYEVHPVNGDIGRPLDPVVDPVTGEPDPTRACQVLYAMEAGRGHAFILGDPRTLQKLPQLKPGEQMKAASGGNFSRWHFDGSITHMTTDTGGDPAGNSVYTRIKPTGFIDFAPWGTRKFDATGYHVLTGSGSRFDLGGLGGLPLGLGSYANLRADVIKLTGLVTMGVGPQKALALAPPLQAWMKAVALALDAIQKTIAAMALNPNSGVTPAQAADVATKVSATQATPPIAATSSSS